MKYGREYKNTIIWDFFGIPGSGKSTASHKSSNEYKELGLKILEPSYELDHNKSKIARKIIKIKYTFFLMLKSPITFLKIYHLTKNNLYTLKNGQLNQIINIAVKIWIIYHYKGKYDYIVFDEGIAQAAISLSVNSHIKASTNLKELLKILSQRINIRFICIDCDLQEALKRIEKRNSRDTRIECLQSKDEKYDLILKYDNAVKEIDNFLKRNN